MSEVELRRSWAGRAERMGFEPRRLDVLLHQHEVPPDIDALVEELVAREALTEQTSTFARRDLLQAVAERLPDGARSSRWRSSPTRCSPAATSWSASPAELREASEESDLSTTAVCLSRFDCLPLRSGIQLHDGLHACSSAFSSARWTLGQLGILSAAHCFGQGQSVAQGAVWFGEVDGRRFGNHHPDGGVDALFVKILEGMPVDAAPWIYRTESNRQHGVVSVGGAGEPRVGDPMEKSGVTTDYSIGVVIRYEDIVVGDVPFDNMPITDTCAQPGDSGAGTFRGRRANGIMSFGAFDAFGQPLPCDDPDFVSVPTPLYRAVDVLNVDVLTE